MNNLDLPSLGLTAVAVLLLFVTTSPAQSPAQWKAHDLERPQPEVVTPAPAADPVPPPSDAIVLFDGSDLSAWRAGDGSDASWNVEDGHFEAAPGAGDLFTRQSFGDIQLHIEWAAPHPVAQGSQDRGNSGVFLMGLYEVQILDSYENTTYADGQAGSIYGQHPPLVNAARPPGEWQTYDIFFRRPRFDANGSLTKPARVTVVHNGILIQDNAEIWGPTMWLQHLPYESHPDRLPLSLQDHGDPVRFRNVWVRELDEWTAPGPDQRDSRPAVTLSEEMMDRYVGEYEVSPGVVYTVSREGDRLFSHFFWPPNPLELVAHSEREFSLRWTAGDVVFDTDEDGNPTALTFHLGGAQYRAERVD